MITQERKITPPIASDASLVDFSSILQANLQQLFGAAHAHVGINGILTAAPAANAGAVGDILIVNAGGVVMLYMKVAASQWYHLGPATKG